MQEQEHKQKQKGKESEKPTFQVTEDVQQYKPSDSAGQKGPWQRNYEKQFDTLQ